MRKTAIGTIYGMAFEALSIAALAECGLIELSISHILSVGIVLAAIAFMASVLDVVVD